MDERRLRIAKNEALFRAINERIEGVNEAFGQITGDFEIVCECGSTDCIERILISEQDYEELRTDPTHFAVIPGHVAPSCEVVLARHDTYDLVEKIEEAAAVAERLDTRGGG